MSNLPCRDEEEAIELAALGRGSLVGSIVSEDAEISTRLVIGTAAHHGRLHLLDRDCAAESTGHGSPLRHLIHGGPGRAGGSEELGGIRVYAGDCIRVQFTCKQKTDSEGEGYGEVSWDTSLVNQRDEAVANYDVLTLVRKSTSTATR